MDYVNKFIEASIQVSDNYLNLERAEFKRRKNELSEEEYDETFKKLVDSIEYEDFCLEEVYLKTTTDDVFRSISDEYEIDGITEEVLNRLVEKIKKRKMEPAIAEQNTKNKARQLLEFMAKDSDFKDIMDAIKGHEEEIKRDLEKDLTNVHQSFIMETEVDLEYSRKLLFFLDKAMETSDDEMFIDLMHTKMNSIYGNPIIEQEMLRSRFYQNADTIGVQNFIGKDESETTEYLILLNQALNNVKVLLLNLVNNNLINSDGMRSIVEYVKCAFRACLYLFDSKQFNHNIKQLEEMMQNVNASGKILLEDIIKLAVQDRVDYPKVEFEKEELAIVSIENKISELYEKLMDLEIRRSNGEDTDFEFQKVSNAIKIASIEEKKIIEEEYRKFLNGQDNGSFMSLYYEIIDEEQIVRLVEILKKIDSNEISEDYGDSIGKETVKCFIFFLEDYLQGITNKNLKEDLIRQKYTWIHATPSIENEILENGGTVSREAVSLEGIIATESEKEQYGRIKVSICVAGINRVISNIMSLHEQNTNRDILNSAYAGCEITVRGLLYMLDEENYDIAIKALEECINSFLINGEYMMISILNGIIKQSALDREKYPKLVL